MGSEELTLRAGFELELLAPAGLSRRSLADAIAAASGGAVRMIWHEDSEPAPVEALSGRFLHLTQGFAVTDAAGQDICTLVDDITIRDGLDQQAAAPAGSYRILTDDVRMLTLLARTCDPAGPLPTLLAGPAEIFGSEPERIGDIWRLDAKGATVALAMPAGGERERPCEIVTVPIARGHRAAVAALLEPARSLGFTVPVEAAVHIHYDGSPFRERHALANLVRLFAYWRAPLRDVLETNANCRRLAPLPEPMVTAVRGTPTIDELRTAALNGRLTKFFDVNLTQVLRDDPVRDTVEVRILPGSIDADDVAHRAGIVERLLLRCLEPQPVPAPDPGDTIAQLLALAGG